MKKILFLVLLLFCCASLFAQQPVSIHLTEKDGVPDNEFYNILEDSKGYIWLAADKGLFRFDGVEYKKFQHPEQIGLSVFQIKEDKEGALWYVNLSGQVFYIKDEKITLFNNYNAEFKGTLPDLRFANEMLILVSTTRLVITNIKTKKIVLNQTHYGFTYLEPSVYNNSIYYGIGGELIKLDLLTLKKKTISYNLDDKRVLQNSRFSILNKDFIYYLFDAKGVSFYRTNENFDAKVKKLHHNLPNTRIVASKIIDNKIWFCTKVGVFVCEVRGDSLKIKSHFFTDQFITDVIKDEHANYWFTTVNNSMFIVPNIEINQVPIPLKRDKILATHKGKENELLVNTLNYNLYKYAFPSGEIKSFSFSKTPEVYLAIRESDSYLFATNRGTYVFNDLFENTKILPSIGTIKDIKKINDTQSITAHSSFIKIINTNSRKRDYKKEIRGYKVFYDAANDLRYFATIAGLLLLDKDLKEEEVLFNNKSIYINAITQTKDGVLWCSSFKKGLYAIKENKVIAHYTEANGLLSNSNQFIKAVKNNIWIAGDSGIQHFNTEESTFKNLTKNEGIVSYNYNGLEIIDDNVFVSSPEQIIYFNEEEVFKPYDTPDVFFTEILINNEKQELKSNYTFEEDTSNVSINYSSVGFKTNTSGQFEYRLLGFDDNWIATKNGPTNVQYNSLLEGAYTFQIRNITASEIGSKTKEIKFEVTKPFWKKLWFYLLLSLFFLAAIVLFYRYKLQSREKDKNRLLKQLEIKNELKVLKLENLRSQMNPHFVFNALNSIQEYIISNKKDLAGDYLGKFADLIRTYLEHSTKGEITLKEEVRTINMYLELEKLRFEDTLEYFIKTSDDIDLEAVIPTMLIQPYIENALKHGLLHIREGRKLWINFVKNADNTITCYIEDNGIGRSRSVEINAQAKKIRPSFATKATESRLNLLNYGKDHKIGVEIIDLYKEDGSAKGTRVVLNIPVVIDS